MVDHLLFSGDNNLSATLERFCLTLRDALLRGQKVRGLLSGMVLGVFSPLEKGVDICELLCRPRRSSSPEPLEEVSVSRNGWVGNRPWERREICCSLDGLKCIRDDG